MPTLEQLRNMPSDLRKVEEAIEHLPIMHICGTCSRGWWAVMVTVAFKGDHPRCYVGKKDRSYFGALKKSIREAMDRMSDD